MAFITADRVKDTSTTTGTGNITVSGSAPFGYRTFSTVLSVSDTFYYAIQGQSTSEWEVGFGTYVSSNQFSRTTVLASSASNSAVSFSSGTKNVFITLPATKTFQLDPSQSLVPGAILYGTGNSTVGYTAAGTVGQILTSNAAGAPTWNTVSGTGTVTSVAVSGGSTGLTTSGGPITTSGTITMAGTLAVANGGTGLATTPANGALDIGNGTGFTRANLTAGANITITNTAGGISIAASGAGTPNTIANGTSSVGIASSNGSIVAATNGTTAFTVDTSQNTTFAATVAMGSSFKRNILINGNYLINQRAYVSGTATASGTYMHDRWKSTTTNSNYTFTQGTPDTTITIAAGTIAQIVEDKNVVGGVYTLSWTGTATARIAINGGTTSGAYAASPITTSSATAGQTITVEFSTGTLGKVQLEPGTIATPYERQIYSDQLAQCQRYYQNFCCGITGAVATTTSIDFFVRFVQQMRASPTYSLLTTTPSVNVYMPGSTSKNGSGSTFVGQNSTADATGGAPQVGGFSLLTTGSAVISGSTSLFSVSAEL